MQLKPVKGNHKFKLAFFIAGMITSMTLPASESDMQLAAFNSEPSSISKKIEEDVDDEIGSTDTSGFENRIGAFSREDGAMMGAYGDGEYAD